MGLPSRIAFHAWHRHGSDRLDDPRKAPSGRRRRGLAYGLIGALAAGAVAAEPIRVATFNVELAREGPGLLLRDIRRGDSEDIAVAAGIIAHITPDILHLTSFDYDAGGQALGAFARLIAERGVDYPYAFALAPNTGVPTGLDLDGDGRLGGPGDAQGYGRFRGHGGMAILSRWPIAAADAVDLSGLLWAEFPGASVPDIFGQKTRNALRLSTTGHWDVPVKTPSHGSVRLLAFYATPPVFDGPEDRNGRRNHDEAALWRAWLDGALEGAPPEERFVIIGDANLDPKDGDGRPSALKALIADPRIQDPEPRSDGGTAAADQGGANRGHRGDPALDTADWADTPADTKPGNLRVDYVLPSADWRVVEAGVFWPPPDDPNAALLGSRERGGGSRHRLVWVDIEPAEGNR
ncbi:MAG: endonuclease/exonuclease/phosphatase family protein [Pseudomonadota bacterium]